MNLNSPSKNSDKPTYTGFATDRRKRTTRIFGGGATSETGSSKNMGLAVSTISQESFNLYKNRGKQNNKEAHRRGTSLEDVDIGSMTVNQLSLYDPKRAFKELNLKYARVKGENKELRTLIQLKSLTVTDMERELNVLKERAPRKKDGTLMSQQELDNILEDNGKESIDTQILAELEGQNKSLRSENNLLKDSNQMLTGEMQELEAKVSKLQADAKKLANMVIKLRKGKKELITISQEFQNRQTMITEQISRLKRCHLEDEVLPEIELNSPVEDIVEILIALDSKITQKNLKGKMGLGKMESLENELEELKQKFYQMRNENEYLKSVAGKDTMEVGEVQKLRKRVKEQNGRIIQLQSVKEEQRTLILDKNLEIQRLRDRLELVAKEEGLDSFVNESGINSLAL
jgi:chromosome segregation ATPase